jgi:putative endonuclease
MKSETPYFVYLLLCGNGAIYTGIAIDVKRRFAEHKSGRGARYTRIFGVVRILYTEPTSSRSEAQRREHEIKQWSPKRKRALAGLR